MTPHKNARPQGLPATESGHQNKGQKKPPVPHSSEVLRRNVADVERFLAENPRLWDELVETARVSVNCGRRFGVREVIERWRWLRPVVSDGSVLRLNNNATPILARLVVERVPECAGLIERRESVYDEVFADRAADRA